VDAELLCKELVDDEGYSEDLYKCSAGFWTIGIGHNIEANGLPKPIIDALFTYDVDTALNALDRTDPNWREHPEEVQRALVNLMFNLGEGKWLKFVNTRAAFARKDYLAAAAGLKASKWYTQVQKSRRDRIIAQVEGAANLPMV
jgi:lysozyme